MRSHDLRAPLEIVGLKRLLQVELSLAQPYVTSASAFSSPGQPSGYQTKSLFFSK